MRRLLRVLARYTTVGLVAPGCIQNTVTPVHSGPTDACAGDNGEGDFVSTADPTPPQVDWGLTEKWRWDGRDDVVHDAHVGRFQDSDGDGVVTSADSVEVLLSSVFDDSNTAPTLLWGDGTLHVTAEDLSGWGQFGSIGDVDPSRPGAEWVLSGVDVSPLDLVVGVAGSILYSATVDVDVDLFQGQPFLTDLDGDAVPELIGGAAVVDSSDGRLLFALRPTPDAQSLRTVASDLDLDGVPELLGSQDAEPAVLDAGGGLLAVCPILHGANPIDSNMIYAIGNLDVDPEGEFVVTRAGIVAICEVTGHIDAEISLEWGESRTVAIAQLDEDEDAELVIDQSAPSFGSRVIAYDTSLNELWRFQLAEEEGTAPLSVADLDGDGRHEVIVQASGGTLYVLGPDGAELASAAAPVNGGFSPPIVSDLDGDGLAEILVVGETPSVAVYTNAAGGWPAAGAQDPWPGVDHFPGDRNVDGTLPTGRLAPWLMAGQNVWGGSATGVADLPDLGVEVGDVCSQDCETTRVIAYVSNVGRADSASPIDVTVYDLGTGERVGSTTVGSLRAGTSVTVDIGIPSDAGDAGIEVTVHADYAEYADAPNSATSLARPCR